MPRSREYDAQAARAGLVAAFLDKGFANASLVDLEKASGLNRRQLYNDFGNKHDIFELALRDFSARAGEQFLLRLERGERGVDDIAETLNGMVDLADTPQGRLGCLVCNTSREAVAHEPAIAELVGRFFERIERGYRDALERARQLGELPPQANLRRLSRFFLGVHVSVCVLCRAGVSVRVLRDITEEALRRVR